MGRRWYIGELTTKLSFLVCFCIKKGRVGMWGQVTEQGWRPAATAGPPASPPAPPSTVSCQRPRPVPSHSQALHTHTCVHTCSHSCKHIPHTNRLIPHTCTVHTRTHMHTPNMLPRHMKVHAHMTHSHAHMHTHTSMYTHSHGAPCGVHGNTARLPQGDAIS